MLHCGNEFLKQVVNFRFKLDDNVPRYASAIKSSFQEKLEIPFSEHQVGLKKILWISL